MVHGSYLLFMLVFICYTYLTFNDVSKYRNISIYSDQNQNYCFPNRLYKELNNLLLSLFVLELIESITNSSITHENE